MHQGTPSGLIPPLEELAMWQQYLERWDEIVRGTMGDIIEKARMTVEEFMTYLK